MPAKYLRLGDDTALRYLHAGPTTLPDVPPPLGRGTAFVFVPGEGGSAPHFAPQLEALGSVHSPLALDLPGHGRSTGLAGLSDLESAAGLLAEALGHLSAPPVVLVGHGLGGWLALATALQAPERLRGVVTLGTGARCEWPDAEIDKLRDVVRGRAGQFFDTPFFAPGTTPEVMRAFFGALVQTDPRVRLSDLEVHRGALPLDRLAQIAVPVRVVRGAEDALCSPEGAAELAGAVGVEVDVIPGAGHVPQLEQPEAVTTLLQEVA